MDKDGYTCYKVYIIDSEDFGSWIAGSLIGFRLRRNEALHFFSGVERLIKKSAAAKNRTSPLEDKNAEPKKIVFLCKKE